MICHVKLFSGVIDRSPHAIVYPTDGLLIFVSFDEQHHSLIYPRKINRFPKDLDQTKG